MDNMTSWKWNQTLTAKLKYWNIQGQNENNSKPLHCVWLGWF